MIDYRVRSISLLTLVNEVNSGRLIPDAYFQRNLVWREIHKKDFIKTILLGLPFPQIFLSKGKVDVENMSSISCVVDGQQRTDAIISYINGDFDVDGKLFLDLDGEKKSDFLKYEIAVIELDLENDDPRVQEIFQRINRTSNALTVIEKLASQYSTSDYMLTAKLLSNEMEIPNDEGNGFKIDPNIPKEYYDWASKKNIKKFVQLITEKSAFTSREISKKGHLMHVLNIMSTLLSTFFNRNDKTMDFLDDYAQDFPDKDKMVNKLERTAILILKLKLRQKSYWYNKANIFSLIIAITKFSEDGNNFDLAMLKGELTEFESNIPEDYKLAASEAVNSTRARLKRDEHIKVMLEHAKQTSDTTGS